MSFINNEDDPDFIPYGNRHYKLYPLTDIELSLLMWTPIWTRWFIIRQIKRETKFQP